MISLDERFLEFSGENENSFLLFDTKRFIFNSTFLSTPLYSWTSMLAFVAGRVTLIDIFSELCCEQTQKKDWMRTEANCHGSWNIKAWKGFLPEKRCFSTWLEKKGFFLAGQKINQKTSWILTMVIQVWHLPLPEQQMSSFVIVLAF